MKDTTLQEKNIKLFKANIDFYQGVVNSTTEKSENDYWLKSLNYYTEELQKIKEENPELFV